MYLSYVCIYHLREWIAVNFFIQRRGYSLKDTAGCGRLACQVFSLLTCFVMITCRSVCHIHVCGHCGKDNNIISLKNEQRSIVSICVCGVDVIVLSTSFGSEIKYYTLFSDCFYFPQKRNSRVNKEKFQYKFIVTVSIKTMKVLPLAVNQMKSMQWIPLLPVNPFSHTRLIYGIWPDNGYCPL